MARNLTNNDPGNTDVHIQWECSEAVVYIQINSCKGEKVPNPRHASGFLFKHGRLSGLMTSNHAVPTKEDAQADRVFIGPEACSAAAYRPHEHKEVVLEPDRLFVTDKTLDYTIIGIKESSCAEVKFMQLWERPVTDGTVVTLLSHPEGMKRQRSDGTIKQLEGNHLFYDIGEQGSTGGPVLFMQNETMYVAALHKATSKDDSNMGTFMKPVIEHFESHNDVPPEFRNDIPVDVGNESDQEEEIPTSNNSNAVHLWAQAYSWCDLAPAVSFSGQNLKFFRRAHKMPHGKLWDKSFLRLADGGFVDNTSIAYLLQHIESNNWSNPKVICLFQNSSSGIIDYEGGEIANDLAKIFGYQKGYWHGYGVKLPTADVHVFEKPKFNSIWSYSNNDVRLDYYRIAAKTIENKQFGIKAGESYDLHIFTSIHQGSGPVPMTKKLWDSYGAVFHETRAGVRDAGGWTHLRKVFSSRNLSIACSGGGWHTHTAMAGWISGCLDSLHEEATVDKLFENVVAISGNSGGTWFLSQLAYSKHFLEHIESHRDEWCKRGYVRKIGEIFRDYWIKNPRANQEPCSWDNMLKRLMKIKKHESEGKSEKVERYSSSGGMYSFKKLLASYNNNWRSFVYDVVYRPFGMAEEIGKFTISDTAKRNLWCRDKELIIVSAVLGGDVLAARKDYTIYKVTHGDTFFIPLVFKNDGYHTYDFRPRAAYFKRQRLFLRQKYDKVDRLVDTKGAGHCYIIDACVASSSAMAAAASPTVLTMAFKAIMRNTLYDSFMPHDDEEFLDDDGKEYSDDTDVEDSAGHGKTDEVMPAGQGSRLAPVVGLLVATVCVALVYACYTVGNDNK